MVVHPGESIQTAIDHAAPYTTIVVAGGVHAEQLTISSDGITLVGRGTKLVPPAVAHPNQCSGLAGPPPGEPGPPTEAGICVIGPDVTFLPFEGDHVPVGHVGRPVRAVRVTGFDIAGFSGPYVAVVGGDGVRVEGNHFTDPTSYGVLSDGRRAAASPATRSPATRRCPATSACASTTWPHLSSPATTSPARSSGSASKRAARW